MKKSWVYIIVAIVVIGALATGAFLFLNNNSGDYVAKVDGEKITATEYKVFLSDVRSQMENLAGVTDAASSQKFWAGKFGDKSAVETARDLALENAKEFKIELIKAKEAKIVLTKQDKADIEAKIKQMITDAGGNAAIEEKMKSTYGVTLAQYKAFAYDIVLRNNFRTKIDNDQKITEDAVKKYYLDKTSSSTTAWHILLATVDLASTTNPPTPLSEDKIKEAEKTANEVLIKVKAGDKFADLAKQYSADTGSKDTGGEYTFAKGKMMKEFEDWAFNANVGDTGIVKTDVGFHVMKKPSYDEIIDKSALKKALLDEKYLKLVDTWKKDTKYNVVKNQKVIDSIAI